MKQYVLLIILYDFTFIGLYGLFGHPIPETLQRPRNQQQWQQQQQPPPVQDPPLRVVPQPPDNNANQYQ